MIGFCILGYIAGVVILCTSFKIGCENVTLGDLIPCLLISAISFIPIHLERNLYSMAIVFAPALSGVITTLIILLVTKADVKLF